MRVLLVQGDSTDMFKTGLGYPTIGIDIRRVSSLGAALEVLGSERDSIDCVLLAPGVEVRLEELVNKVREAAKPLVVLVPSDGGSAVDLALRVGASDALLLPQSDGAVARAVVSAVALGRATRATAALALAQSTQAATEASSRRLSALVEADRALAQAIEPEQALVAVSKAIVPSLADACAIDLLDDDGVLRRYPLVDEGATTEPSTAPGEPGVLAQVLSWSEPCLLNAPLPEVLRQILRGGESPAKPGAVKDALLVPLRGGESPIGVLSLLIDGARPTFTPDERWAAEQLGVRLSAALDAGRRATRAKQASEARDHLTSVVSHDLRNPLFNIQMASDELLATAPQPYHRHIEIIRRATRQMNKLIQDLLDVSRIESGRLALERGRFEVASAVNEALLAHAALATQRSIEVRNELPEGLPRLLADRERVVQALANLVHNAIKFSPERSKVTVTAEARGSELWLLVRDVGPGIAAEQLPRIFDRFAHAKRKDRRSTGLGLAIARGLVELHGGRIWVESQQGEGSTFAFALPLEATP